MSAPAAANIVTRALHVVGHLLEDEGDAAEDIKDFLISKARTDTPTDEDIHFGIRIRTTDDFQLKERAQELGLELTPAVIEELSRGIGRAESNILEILDEHDVSNADEGHADDELVISAWVRPGSDGWNWLLEAYDWDADNLESQEPWSTSSGTIWWIEDGVDHTIFAGVSELTQRLVDFDLSLFNTQRLAEAWADHHRLLKAEGE